MRCRSCNTLLTPFETSRKYLDNTYADLCNSCFRASDYKEPVIANYALLSVVEEEVDPVEEEENE